MGNRSTVTENSDVTSFQSPELASTEQWIAGVDEVGRGALFGPVVASAVILPGSALEELRAMGLKESKQLSSKRREEFSRHLQTVALDAKIGYASVREIDRVNIFHASLLAMRRAVLKLDPQPDLCLVDGKFLIPDLPIPQKALVGGDRASLVIAAASIVAKVWRDRLIIRLANKYPRYDLAANKGYGTERHRLALQQYGASSQHRLSFKPCQMVESP
ncbi:ribonuclease HII [Lusitaniella coriacea LEGE 07157]|uniref:Ribonuclease HII n=1 Tax=Lusitaniella coriacea LEGE 07157 TaxID=945747 RepID=A0A8J7AW94_9CYAN|nr:ribonuclease HII [Lusitaniella coriacea]MBE9114522.1 ribonuclease HII [Lusitaniella coriacea LEGE 07157]